LARDNTGDFKDNRKMRWRD